MNSKKVKEIKKTIQETIDGKLSTEYLTVCEISCCPRLDIDKLFADILTLINELESENKELEDEIVESENEKRRLCKTINNVQKGFDNGEFISKDCQTKTLKQFAERLKDKFYYVFGNEYEQSVSGFNTKVLIEYIDETLKEYENDTI